MVDPDTKRGSLPAFAIVLAALLGLMALILVVFLIVNRKRNGGSYSLLRRSKPKGEGTKWQVVYPPDESNPRPPPNVAPRHQPTSHHPPTRPSPLGGPAQNLRNQHQESQRLLPPSNQQGFVPREVELRTQPSKPSVAGFASRDPTRSQGPKVPGPYRQSPQYRLYQQQGNAPSLA